jgi:hypothetical protein
VSQLASQATVRVKPAIAAIAPTLNASPADQKAIVAKPTPANPAPMAATLPSVVNKANGAPQVQSSLGSVATVHLDFSNTFKSWSSTSSSFNWGTIKFPTINTTVSAAPNRTPTFTNSQTGKPAILTNPGTVTPTSSGGSSGGGFVSVGSNNVQIQPAIDGSYATPAAPVTGGRK